MCSLIKLLCISIFGIEGGRLWRLEEDFWEEFLDFVEEVLGIPDNLLKKVGGYCCSSKYVKLRSLGRKQKIHQDLEASVNI
jgi:hypothetical protein